MNIRSKLIENGVKNLQEYGYPACDKDSILTDQIYSAFFASMLKDNIGAANDETDLVISELLAEIETDLLTTEVLIKRLRYQGRQYSNGQEARGSGKSVHMLTQAADRLAELEADRDRLINELRTAKEG